MSDFLEHLYEFVVTLLIIGASLSSVVFLVNQTNTPIVELGSDKSMIEVPGAIAATDEALTGHDILLMLMNVDDMSPYPRAVKINDTPVIKLDSSYVSSKMFNLAVIYNPVGVYKLSTLLDKKVIKREYVYDQPESPYIHYVLEN